MKIFSNAKYIEVKGYDKIIELKIDGKLSMMPINKDNTDYVELMRQVDAGELTIEAAE